MGGAFEVKGNVTLYLEFNIFNDPHAGNIVFSSGIPITLLGLDVCTQVAFDRVELASWNCNSVGACLAIDVLSTWFNDTQPALDRYILCDPLAIAAAVLPGIFETRTAIVSVEVKDSNTLGQTRANYGSGNVHVAIGVDVEQARSFVLERLEIDT